MLQANASIDATRFPNATRLQRQQYLMQEHLSFLQTILEENRTTTSELRAYTERVRPAILENVYEAARGQLLLLNASLL